METQRDKALVQLATDRREASILRVKVWTLAQKVDECQAMITELGARELQGNTCTRIFEQLSASRLTDTTVSGEHLL